MTIIYSEDSKKLTRLLIYIGASIFIFIGNACYSNSYFNAHCSSNEEPEKNNRLACDATLTLPAFPGAEGFGKNAIGGREGNIIYVENLNSSGTGSFKAACEASGPRIVVFRVSGQITIPHEQRIIIRDSYITIAGETAPGDGIVLVGDATTYTGIMTVKADHVIIRNIAFRPGPGILNCAAADPPAYLGGTDIEAVTISGKNVILDHCSLAFSTDELMSTPPGANLVTISNCVMSHPLQWSTHYYNCDPDKPNRHGRGPLLYGRQNLIQNTTFYRNYMAHLEYRSPAIKWGNFQVINNITFNHEWGMIVGPQSRDIADIIGNVFLSGLNSDISLVRDLYVTRWNTDTFPESDYDLYLLDNYGHERQYLNDSEWGIVDITDERHRVFSQNTTDHPLTNGAIDNYYDLPSSVGARASMWDSSKNEIDKLAIRDLRQRTQAGWIDHPSEIIPSWPNLNYRSGTPYPDTDNNGIDDNWEAYFGGNLSQNGYNISNDYTNIECFLHELAGDDVHYSDIDGDGMPNYWEDKFNISSPGADHDNDGLSNLNEYLNRTHPRKSDTDGDGADDLKEIDFGVDPNNHLIYPVLLQDPDNLLSNAYFENETLTNWGGGASETYAISPARTQLKSAKVTDRTSAGFGLDQNITSILESYGNGSYTFSGHMLSEHGMNSATGIAEIWLKYNDNWVKAATTNANINDDTWVQLSQTVNLNWPGSLQSALIRFRTSNTIDFYVDDASLTTPNSAGCNPPIGAACDDNDRCTIDDVINDSCNCVGSIVDSDTDGVCDADDICPGFDDFLDSDNDGIPNGCDFCQGDCHGEMQFCDISPPPTINGFVGDWLGYDYHEIDKAIWGTISSNDDMNARFKLAWDFDNLYIFGFILDDIRINDSPSSQPWKDDSVEILIDGGGEASTTYDSNDRDILFRYNDNTIYNYKGGNTANIEFSQHSGDFNEIEIKLPWSYIGVNPYAGMNIGFDIHIYDDDDGGDRDGKLAWHDTTNTAWEDPSKLKMITLSQCSCITNLIESQNQQIDQSVYVQQMIETNGKVISGNTVDYVAGEYISMNPSFEVELGALYHAYIATCNP